MTTPTQDRPRNPDPTVAGRLTLDRELFARSLAMTGLGAVTVSAALMTALHLLPASRILNPISATLSEYALTPVGWMFNTGVLVLAAGSAAVLGSLLLRRLVRPGSPAAVMIAVWCVGLVGLIVFHKQTIGLDESLESRVHWTWTLIAFFSLPIGAALLGRPHRVDGECARPPRWAVRMSWLSGFWFVVLALQTFFGAVDRTSWPTISGLIERALSAVELITVGVLAVWALRDCNCARRV